MDEKAKKIYNALLATAKDTSLTKLFIVVGELRSEKAWDKLSPTAHEVLGRVAANLTAQER
jgi:hypothetical protein